MQKSSIPIINYIIQNQINIDLSVVPNFDTWQYFVNPIPELDELVIREMEITKVLLNSISAQLDVLKDTADWRKINSRFLLSKITMMINSKMIIESGSLVKFITTPEAIHNLKMGAAAANLTSNKLYQVINSRVGWDTSLFISLRNDAGHVVELPYRYFEEVIKMREDKISSLFD